MILAVLGAIQALEVVLVVSGDDDHSRRCGGEVGEAAETRPWLLWGLLGLVVLVSFLLGLLIAM